MLDQPGPGLELTLPEAFFSVRQVRLHSGMLPSSDSVCGVDADEEERDIAHHDRMPERMAPAPLLRRARGLGVGEQSANYEEVQHREQGDAEVRPVGEVDREGHCNPPVNDVPDGADVSEVRQQRAARHHQEPSARQCVLVGQRKGSRRGQQQAGGAHEPVLVLVGLGIGREEATEEPSGPCWLTICSHAPGEPARERGFWGLPLSPPA
mmetsp:Transcript_53745/g.156697  ORF Transcript_53745/g.156697 Transcript_53745/m.156697 type:complete len:209 (-) Transcript_53745:1-627(-)